MIEFTSSGSTDNTRNFLKAMQRQQSLYSGIDGIAQRGVAALQAATPTDSGVTGMSWSAKVDISGDTVKVGFFNSHIENGVNIAVILQYGHGTGTGGYVAGRDYINPALKPIFDEIANDVWKKVTSA